MSIYTQFKESEDKQKFIILALIVIVLAGAWYYFFYADHSKKISSLKVEVNKMLRYKRQLPKIRKEYKVAIAEFKNYKKILPLKEEIPSLLVGLSSIIKSEDVSMIRFNPHSPVDKKIYMLKPINISVAANYNNCGAVFEKISKMKRLVKVKDFSMSSPKIVGSNNVVVNVKFNAETYYFKKAAKTK